MKVLNPIKPINICRVKYPIGTKISWYNVVGHVINSNEFQEILGKVQTRDSEAETYYWYDVYDPDFNPPYAVIVE